MPLSLSLCRFSSICCFPKHFLDRLPFPSREYFTCAPFQHDWSQVRKSSRNSKCQTNNSIYCFFLIMYYIRFRPTTNRMSTRLAMMSAKKHPTSTRRKTSASNASTYLPRIRTTSSRESIWPETLIFRNGSEANVVPVMMPGNQYLVSHISNTFFNANVFEHIGLANGNSAVRAKKNHPFSVVDDCNAKWKS